MPEPNMKAFDEGDFKADKCKFWLRMNISRYLNGIMMYLINEKFILFRCERASTGMCGRCCATTMQIQNTIIWRPNIVCPEEACLRQLHAIH